MIPPRLEFIGYTEDHDGSKVKTYMANGSVWEVRTPPPTDFPPYTIPAPESPAQ